MHYYQYNIADYRKDTTHLSLLEHGCYRQLLDQYYLDEKPLPADEDKLFRLFNARTEDEKQAMRNVLMDFWTKTEGGYVQGRSDREIQTYKERLETASRAGRKSANLRANSNGRSTGVDLNSTGVQLTNNSITNNLTTNNQYISKDFDIFWNEYPKKKKKEDARKAWNTIRPNIEVVLKALEWQKKSPEWFKQAGQFIPYPASWIRSHSWEDQPSISVTF